MGGVSDPAFEHSPEASCRANFLPWCQNRPAEAQTPAVRKACISAPENQLKVGTMDHRETTVETDKIHQNRLFNITDDEEEQDAAFTIVRVLDKVATIVDSVQASQKRIEERHREMEDAIKTIQIDLLKLAQAHSSTGYTVNKLLQKTRKVSARVKEVRARVEKQGSNVRKVEAKQEEMLRKNKFRVVIYQVNRLH